MRQASATPAAFAVLALAWLIGGGLWVAPSEISDAIRGPVRDAMQPGQVGLAVVVAAAESRWTEWRRDDQDGELRSVEKERDEWRDRFLALQAAQAAQAGEGSDPQRLPLEIAASPSEPLTIPDVVHAAVLGVERDLLRERTSRLLSRGTTDGIAVDDIVLAGPLPLLDQGSDSQVAPDMPVLAGGCVVGRIKLSGRWTSTVEPVTDPEFRSYIRLVRPTARGPLFGAEGLLVGNGDGTCGLELIAATEPVSVGDYVYGRMPDAASMGPLCYGRVVAAELPEGAAHWVVTVAPFTLLDEHRSVQILRELPNPVRMASHFETP